MLMLTPFFIYSTHCIVEEAHPTQPIGKHMHESIYTHAIMVAEDTLNSLPRSYTQPSAHTALHNMPGSNIL